MAGLAKYWNASPTKPSVLYESAYDSFWTASREAFWNGLQIFQIRYVRLRGNHCMTLPPQNVSLLKLLY